MPYTSIALIICSVVFYYQVGESEYFSRLAQAAWNMPLADVRALPLC